MKHIQRITSATLSLLLLGSLAVPTFAGETSSEKEEVIYIMTDASGKVTDMEAVNSFAGGNITDYGDYSGVKILNTTDAITQDGNKITFSTSANKVYYQGTLNNAVSPWKISIRYFLDGKEYSAEDIAGKSGALEIRFSVSENENCKSSFYDSYALQASFTLDTDLCENIASSGATVANVGSNKQLTYTILPGKGISTSIFADVTDFEMSAVSINGIRLNLDFDVDDSVLTEKVNEIFSALTTLNNGATEVNDGTSKLCSATETLNSKVGELDSGVGELASGAGNLSSGLSDITAKNTQLTGSAYTIYESLCTSASATLNAQLKPMGITVNLTPANYSATLQGLLNKVGAESDAGKQISALKAQLDNYGTFYQSLVAYTNAVDDASNGAKELKQNMDTLHSNTGTLKSSVGELNESMNKLYGGTKTLANGTTEFVDKTSDMDTKISDEIDSMISSITGSDAEVVSFVSGDNTNVDSVQFVIKTSAIEKAEATESDDADEATLSFWQKLLSLFGL